MNKKVSVDFALAVIIIVVAFFGILASSLNKQTSRQIGNGLSNSFREEIFRKHELGKNNKQFKDQGIADVVTYTNEEIGFRLTLPNEEKKYAVKELDSKGKNRSILFGLPIFDEEIIKNKKEYYSEVFRIELVPIADTEKNKNKTCADKSRQFPLCDNDDLELGRNEQFVFIYTRYDKLDAVEKSKIKMIPADFDSSVFFKADEIAKSFSLVLTQGGMEDKKI
jgi:hypothetical protein